MKIITGIDIVEDARIQQLSAEALTMYLTEAEIVLNKPQTLFAIKEAVAKAFSIVPPPWKDIEVYYKNSKPYVELTEELACILVTQDVSVSHEKGLTTAVFVGVLRDES
jgi:phosphopantetheine--protein transferase-like protein